MGLVTDISTTEYEILDKENYSEAAISTNPNVKWVKFVFTDDQPNQNGKRIDKREFPNIIKTGVYMPIKMEEGNPDGTHQLSTPIGTITNLTENGNKIVGLAALWEEERPDDVRMLEEQFKNGKALNLSWELFYTNSEVDESGIESLKNIAVRGITFVKDPAYAGRTPVLAIASTCSEEAKLPENTNQPNVEQPNPELDELKAKIASLEEELANAKSQIEALTSENSELRAFKEEIEAQRAESELLSSRRKALEEAGVILSDEDFESKSEMIKKMDNTTFEFYVQELVAFSKKLTESSKNLTQPQIPDLAATIRKDPVEILRTAIKK